MNNNNDGGGHNCVFVQQKKVRRRESEIDLSHLFLSLSRLFLDVCTSWFLFLSFVYCVQPKGRKWTFSLFFILFFIFFINLVLSPSWLIDPKLIRLITFIFASFTIETLEIYVLRHNDNRVWTETDNLIDF